MSKKLIKDAKENLAQSAIDFLGKAVGEIEQHPKYSVIHFAIAVELILKARLMNEHWSLVVEKTSDADIATFLEGKCKTVNPTESVRRLQKICAQSISKEASIVFSKLAAHRNRMLHFFHEAGTKSVSAQLVEEIVKEQFLCWFHLERLLGQWKDQFWMFEHEIAQIRNSMIRNRSYLKVAFDSLIPSIKEDEKLGVKFDDCSGCGYEAAAISSLTEVLLEKKCQVCELVESLLVIDCLGECGAKIQIFAEEGRGQTCLKCNQAVSSSDLKDILDTEYVDPVDYLPTNCAHCASTACVVKHHEFYICTECLAVANDISHCEWCNESQLGGGDLEYSYYSGCEFCDGHSGWRNDH